MDPLTKLLNNRLVLVGDGALDRVRLQVGERTFHTTRSTLTPESPFLAKLLAVFPGDTPYFIDYDPEPFADMLNYLRSQVLPVYYNSHSRDFDYGRYAALLGAARHFGVQKLEDWIQDEGYQEVVRTEYTEVIETLAENTQTSTTTTVTNEPLDISYHAGKKQVYVCPRGIPVHRGKPDACGHLCKKERAETGWLYDEVPTVIRVTVRTQRHFNPNSCSKTEEDAESTPSQDEFDF